MITSRLLDHPAGAAVQALSDDPAGGDAGAHWVGLLAGGCLASLRGWPHQGRPLLFGHYRYSSHVSAAEVRTGQVGTRQVGTLQACPLQAGAPEARIFQLAATEACADRLSAIEILMCELEAVQIRIIQIRAAEVRPLRHALRDSSPLPVQSLCRRA